MKRIFLVAVCCAFLTMPAVSYAKITKIAGVRISNVEEAAATVTWRKQRNIKFYQVQMFSNSGEKLYTWKKVKNRRKKIKSSQSVLSAGTEYKIRVRACAAKKRCGKWSNSTWFTTIAATPQYSLSQCTSNIYNCSDFASHEEAQGLYDYCVSQGYGDIHRLDADNDGLACESN